MTGYLSIPAPISTCCWSAARSPSPANWPTTSAAAAHRFPSPSWSASPDLGGPWRKPSSSPKMRLAWTTTKSAATTPGTGTSPYPCSPPRSWPSPPTPNEATAKRGRRRQHQTPDPLVLQRNPAPVGHPEPPHPPPPPHQPLVHLATSPPNPSKTKPLPATTPQTSQDAAVVLSTRWLRRAAEVDQDPIDRGPSDAKQVAGRRKPWPRRGACPLDPEQADLPDASAVVE